MDTAGGGKGPSSIDWRAQGAVTHVKNQGQCGSCWAFSAVGAIEGVHQIATGTLVSFSEQQVAACCHTGKPAPPAGCNGGTMDSAFECVIKEGGLDPENAYPYHVPLGKCKINKTAEIKHVISGYKDVQQPTSGALQAAVAKRPVSVAVDASQGWQLYGGGVMSKQCGDQLDHGVLVVGYTQNYWIVKNSWGPGWGEAGYIRLQRHDCTLSLGECGILADASYPVV